MKKITIALKIPMLLLAVLILSGCSNSVRNENNIMRDLEAHPSFLASEVNSIEILRRQTVQQDNIDSVWVTVSASQGNVAFELSYELTYILYNDGWRLRDVERYWGGVWQKEAPTQAQVLADVQVLLEFDEFISNQNLTIEHIDLLDTFAEESHFPADTVTIAIPVDVFAENEGASFSLMYDALFWVGEDGWEIIGIDLFHRHATPLTVMPQSEIDAFVAGLMGRFAFDTFSFVYRATDLDMFDEALGMTIAFDEVQYTGIRQYPFLEETFAFFVHPQFDTWEGNWNVSTADIDEYLINQDWDVSGLWHFHREGHNLSGLASIDFLLDIESFEDGILEGMYSFFVGQQHVENSGRIAMRHDYSEPGFVGQGPRFRRDYYYVLWNAWNGRPLFIIDRNEGVVLRMGGSSWHTPIRFQ